MAYTRTTWQDGVTPVDASRLNNIELGVVDHDTRLDALEARWFASESYQEIIASVPANSHVSQQIGAIAKSGFTLIGLLAKCSYGDNVSASVVEYTAGDYWVHAVSKWGAELTNVQINITAIFLKTT